MPKLLRETHKDEIMHRNNRFYPAFANTYRQLVTKTMINIDTISLQILHNTLTTPPRFDKLTNWGNRFNIIELLQKIEPWVWLYLWSIKVIGIFRMMLRQRLNQPPAVITQPGIV